MIQNADQIQSATIAARHSSDFRLLENADWETAETVAIDHEWSGALAPRHRHARAQILWTTQSLLVRFVCNQSGPPLVNANPQFHQKTIRLWDKDVCEIFLAPDTHHAERYFEFEAAPTGEWVDLAIQVTGSGRETNWEYHSGITVETSMTESEIVIAMRIPWSESLPEPQAGDSWKLNLFRCVGTGNERYLAWRPTYTPQPYFHVPKVFGRLDFL